MSRRLIVLCFQAATQLEAHYAYDWSEFEEEYYKLWTDYDALKEGYFPLLRELAQMSPTMTDLPDPSYWQILQMPIATGVYSGIWSNIWEAKQHFEEYYKMLPSMKKSSVKDLFSMLVEVYVQSHHPRLVKLNNRPDNPMQMDVNEISLATIKQWIQSNGVGVSQRDVRDTLPKLLSDYGYVSQKSDEGIIFVRETI
jgi:hypothetical protein